jgi:hypothetical protein
VIDVRVTGGKNGVKAFVSDYGVVAVGPLEFDNTIFQALDAADTAFNFYEGRAGENFIVSGLRLKATRSVDNATDATIIIYEASSASSTVVDKIIYQEGLVRGESASFLPVNILVTEGKYVNAKTDDATVNINIVGYYVDSLTKIGLG